MSAYSGFNKQPKIYSTDSQYTICLFNKNYFLNTLDDNHSLNQIFNYLKDGKVASRAKIEEELGLKKSATLDLLNKLKLLGTIITVGKGPNTRYSLKDSKL